MLMMVMRMVVTTVVTILSISCSGINVCGGADGGKGPFAYGFVTVIPTTTTSTITTRTTRTRTTPSRGSSSRWYYNQRVATTFTSRTILHSTSADDHNENMNGNMLDPNYVWTLQNDFEQFLNQCTIQSLVFTLNSLRDRQTALWLEDYTQPILISKKRLRRAISSNTATTVGATGTMSFNPQQGQEGASSMEPQAEHQEEENDDQGEQDKKKNIEIELLTYHGLNIINTTIYPTWHTFYELLLEKPKENYIIQSSSNRFVPEYELEINPSSLCTRLISVREQICNEFTNDLDIIADLGGQTINTYWNNLIKETSSNEDGGGSSSSGRISGSDDEQPPLLSSSLSSSPLAGGTNMFFLESDDYFNDNVQPSPLRKGNFDLLLLLTTQEAIHRLLNKNNNQLQHDDDDDNNSNDYNNILFLKNFYISKLETHFVGNLESYGNADSFLRELLTMSPSMIQLPPIKDATNAVDPASTASANTNASRTAVALIDPMRIVELILLEREKIAIEWADLTLDIIDFKHVDIKRKQLNQLMSSYASRDSNNNDNNANESESGTGGIAKNNNSDNSAMDSNNYDDVGFD